MELKAYAIDFLSFLMEKIKRVEQINMILLFGSTARDQGSKNSDIDIFVDLTTENKSEKDRIEKEIKSIKEEFYSSIKFKDYWNLKGIKNEINIIIDNLKDWKLKDSMIGSSIILYQKYNPALKKENIQGENKTILSWEAIKPNSKRVMLNKSLFGYNYYGKRYSGLIEKQNSEKIGSNVILISSKDINEFEKLFKRFRVTIKIRQVFEYKK